MNTESTTRTFHINGMRCKSCALLIEDALKELPNVSDAKVSLADRQMEITGNFTGSAEVIADELTKSVKNHGYVISAEKIVEGKGIRWGDFVYAAPLSIMLIAVFLGLQKLGLSGLITSSNVSYGTAFVIGLIASVSTCLAVVGGLVLSFSANSAKEGGTWRPEALFHAGRIIGFFALGGVIGTIGSSFRIGIGGNIALGALVALTMLILGLNLLDVFDFTKKLQFTFPVWLSKGIIRGDKPDHYLAPALIGAGTFFLPCGFTQSMQFYALSTGSFMKGALTMLSFSLGTFPMLALLSFGAFSLAQKKWNGIFFKTAGIIVIALGLYNLAGTLAMAGIINPIFNI